MSKEKQFKSVLAPYIQSFLEEYSQKGFKLESRKNNLVSIDEYLYSINGNAGTCQLSETDSQSTEEHVALLDCLNI